MQQQSKAARYHVKLPGSAASDILVTPDTALPVHWCSAPVLTGGAGLVSVQVQLAVQ